MHYLRRSWVAREHLSGYQIIEVDPRILRACQDALRPRPRWEEVGPTVVTLTHMLSVLRHKGLLGVVGRRVLLFKEPEVPQTDRGVSSTR